MASFDSVFKKKTEGIPELKQGKLFRIHYSKLEQSSYQYREITKAAIEKLADLLEADGEVLQPLLVRRHGADTYEILAGHKRFLACRMLVEERGEEAFAMIPCCLRSLDDIKAEFAVYSTNGYESKTPYEQMKEIEGMARLMKEHPEAFPAEKGRLVERIGRQLHLSRSVVGDYQNISHNLGEKGKAAFREGKLDKSAALTMASFSKQQQEEMVEKGILTRKKIREYSAAGEKTVEKKTSWRDVIQGKREADAEIPENSLKRSGTESKEKEKGVTGKRKERIILPTEKNLERPMKTASSGRVLEECSIGPEQLSKISRVGRCPSCSAQVFYPVNLKFCGYCGSPVYWKL